MSTPPVTIELMPLHGGAYTRLRLSALVPTPLPGLLVKKLCRLLMRFGGERVQFVLFVDREAAPWCELWVDSIAELPDRMTRVRFRRNQGGLPHDP